LEDDLKRVDDRGHASPFLSHRTLASADASALAENPPSSPADAPALAPAPRDALAPAAAPAPNDAPTPIDAPAPTDAPPPIDALAPNDAPPIEALAPNDAPPIDAPAPNDAPPETPMLSDPPSDALTPVADMLTSAPGASIRGFSIPFASATPFQSGLPARPAIC